MQSEKLIVKCVCQHCQRVTVVPQETLKAALSAAEPSVAVKALEWIGNFGKSPVGQTMCYRVLFNENGAGWGYPEKGRGYYAEQDSGFLVSGPHETHGLAKAAAQADYEARIRSALTAQVQEARSDDDEETYQIGVRDGYSQAVQEIDRLTGGDGEYRYCTDHDPERHTPGPAEMIQRIVDRFETLNLIDGAEKRGDFWDASGSAQVQDVTGTVEAFDKSHPELYWHIAKGKVTAGEPLYGAVIMDLRGKELGHGESDVSAVDAFNIAVSAAAPAKHEGKP